MNTDNKNQYVALKAKIEILETNLDAQKRLTQSNNTDLESKISAANSKLTILDDYLKSNEKIRSSIDQLHQNQQEYLTSRWNFVTSMIGFIILLVGFVFSYQVFRVEQVMETKKALETTARTLSNNVDMYTKILSLMSDIEAKLTYATIEFSRANFEHASDVSSDAIERLERSYFYHPEYRAKPEFVKDPVKCQFEVKTEALTMKSMTDEERNSLQLPPELKSSLDQMYFAALDFHARASFANEQYKKVLEDAIKLGRIDQTRWEPYHWMGLYHSNPKEGGDSYTDAKTCFEYSVQRNNKSNPDTINLAEMALVTGDYSTAIKHSKEYLEPKASRDAYLHPDNPRQLIALFYENIAEYVSTPKEMPDLQKLREVIRDSKIDLTGSYQDKSFKKFLASDTFMQITDIKRREISKTHLCLMDRKECS